MAGSRQSYCKNYLAYFFWPTLYMIQRHHAHDALTSRRHIYIDKHALVGL